MRKSLQFVLVGLAAISGLTISPTIAAAQDLELRVGPVASAFTIAIAIVTGMIGADRADATRMMLSTSHVAKDFAERRSYACLPAVSLCRG